MLNELGFHMNMLTKTKQALYNAGRRPNHSQAELDNINKKIHAYETAINCIRHCIENDVQFN